MSVLYWVVPEKIRTSPTEEMENDPPPFGHPSTAKPPPPPQTAKPKIIPSSDIGYFKRFNKSWQQQSNLLNFCNFDKLSERQALVLQLRETFSQLAVATQQQCSIKGQLNEGQSLKSKQTFRFEADRYYFN